MKAEIEFESSLEKINEKDFSIIKKDQIKEIEFDIKDETHDKDILN